MSEFTDALRDVADFMDAHPELPQPTFAWLTVRMSTGPYGKYADSQQIKRILADALRAGCEKHYVGSTFEARKIFGDTDPMTGTKVDLTYTTDREQVCQKVPTGEYKEVTKPDPNAPTITVQEPVYDWECDPILKDDNE